MPRKGELTLREYKAICHYVSTNCDNQTNSALQAGFPPGAARNALPMLLQSKPGKELYSSLLNRVLSKLKKTAEDVLDELALCGFLDPGDYFNETPAGGLELKHVLHMGKERRAIKKIKHKKEIITTDADLTIERHEYEYEMIDKLKALEILAKHHKVIAGGADEKFGGSGDEHNGPVIYLPDNGRGGKAVIAVEWGGKEESKEIIDAQIETVPGDDTEY